VVSANHKENEITVQKPDGQQHADAISQWQQQQRPGHQSLILSWNVIFRCPT
jgi:hypothetical protein